MATDVGRLSTRDRTISFFDFCGSIPYAETKPSTLAIMLAIGRDRVEPRDDGTVVLSTPFEKGWRARLQSTKIDAEHPGVAIDTGDKLWEVVEVRPLSNGVRYTLAPWRDDHTIRDIERYDEESEALRAELRIASQKRETKGRITFLLAIFAGHLPAHVQNEMESEYGIVATRMSLLSAYPLFMGAMLGLAIGVVKAAMNEPPIIPARLIPLLFFLLVESMLRLLYVVTQHKPIGSLAGALAYRLYLLTGGTAAPLPRGVASKVRIPMAPTPEELIERDRLRLYEPLVALLPAADQRRIEAAHEISLAEPGRTGAIAVMIVSLLGIAVSAPPFRNGPQLISLAVAVYLLVEQVARLVAIARGARAGSVLGILARPFTRRYL